jgi:hypothetical protein
MATGERVAVSAGVCRLRERARSLVAAAGRLSPSELSSRWRGGGEAGGPDGRGPRADRTAGPVTGLR